MSDEWLPDGGVSVGLEGSVGMDDRDDGPELRLDSRSVRLLIHDVALEHVAGGEGELLALGFEPWCAMVEAATDALEGRSPAR